MPDRFRYRSVWWMVSVTFLLLATAGLTLRAQTDTASVPISGGGAFYDFSGQLGGIPMVVNIWGYVRSPGHYKVPSSTTLVELISLAGGPTEHAHTDQIRVVHDLEVDSTIRNAVVLYNMETFIATGDKAQNPILYPNSTVYVPGDSNPPSFQNTLSIVASIATVTLSVIGIFVALNQN